MKKKDPGNILTLERIAKQFKRTYSVLLVMTAIISLTALLSIPYRWSPCLLFAALVMNLLGFLFSLPFGSYIDFYLNEVERKENSQSDISIKNKEEENEI